MAGGKTAVNLFMGQGVVGNLDEMILSSGQFSTCAPVVFYNEDNHLGGLYHFPGQEEHELTGQNNYEAISEMCRAVNPTQVFIFVGIGGMDGHLKVVEDIVLLETGSAEILHQFPDGAGQSNGAKKTDQLNGGVEKIQCHNVSHITVTCGAQGLAFEAYAPDFHVVLGKIESVAGFAQNFQEAQFFGDPEFGDRWIGAEASVVPQNLSEASKVEMEKRKAEWNSKEGKFIPTSEESRQQEMDELKEELVTLKKELKELQEIDREKMSVLDRAKKVFSGKPSQARQQVIDKTNEIAEVREKLLGKESELSELKGNRKKLNIPKQKIGSNSSIGFQGGPSNSLSGSSRRLS